MSAPEPPKLLYVSTLDRIVGVMLPHLDAAQAAGWRVEVACQPTILGDDLRRHADAVHTVPLRRFPLHPTNLIALVRLVRLIRAERYTIVHCHNPTGGFLGRLAATLARTDALRVYTAHGFHFHRHGGRLSNLVYRLAETVAGRWWSDGVLVITREDYDAAQRWGVVPADRLFLTGGVGVSACDDFNPALVSPHERRELRREAGAEENAIPILTMVGEMIPRKRHADALEVFARVRRSHPDAVLLLVGDGMLSEKLKGMASERGIADGVRFLGFRRDIRRILASTDVFLFPSQQEGLPCAVQEAMAMGVPVVATDVRGNADLVDKTCGRLAPLGDVGALAEGVCELLALDQKTRQEMGQAGRDKMLSLYERSACVAEWWRIYDVLLARRKALSPVRDSSAPRAEERRTARF
jgi:glycosyltransferase involved in cell wall biosynthesis